MSSWSFAESTGVPAGGALPLHPGVSGTCTALIGPTDALVGDALLLHPVEPDAYPDELMVAGLRVIFLPTAS